MNVLFLDRAIDVVMKREDFQYDEDGEIYSREMPCREVVSKLRNQISQYAVVNEGQYRIGYDGVRINVSGNDSKAALFRVYPDGSSKMMEM